MLRFITYLCFCTRYKGEQKRKASGSPERPYTIPSGDLPGDHRPLPSVDADPETVFLCRKVYDLKRKRVLKNPQPYMGPASPSPKSQTTVPSQTPAAS